jgi:HEAT repeat protein
VDELKKASKDRDEDIRITAVVALGLVGKDAVPPRRRRAKPAGCA